MSLIQCWGKISNESTQNQADGIIRVCAISSFGRVSLSEAHNTWLKIVILCTLSICVVDETRSFKSKSRPMIRRGSSSNQNIVHVLQSLNPRPYFHGHGPVMDLETWTCPSSGLGFKSDSTLFLSQSQISCRLQHCLAYCSWVYMRRISYLQNITGRGRSSWKDLLYLHHWLHLWLNATWDAYSCTKKSRNHLVIQMVTTDFWCM